MFAKRESCFDKYTYQVKKGFMNRLGLVAVGATGLTSFAFGQQDLVAANQYYHFRMISGLPGSGFGVLPDGTPDFSGAMSFSSPIGYGLSNWHFSGEFANLSDYGFFRLPHLSRDNKTDSQGKAYAMLGIPLKSFGSLTISYVLNSGVLDNFINLQYQVPLNYKNVGLSFGVQDIKGTRGTGTEGTPGGNGSSQSFFGVVTVPLPKGMYVSAGTGSRRFDKGFANFSAPIGTNLKLVLEHDGFNFNENVAYLLPRHHGWSWNGHPFIPTIMLGFVRSKYACWSINISF